MTRKDGLLALLVVVVWGLNFVVIKLGLHNMPPLMLAGLRFMLVAFPALLFVARPAIPLRLLLGYGLTISFGQFAFLFCAIGTGMPAGLASLVLQAQAFFTIILGAFVFGERLQGKQLAGIALAIFGVLVLVEGSLGGEHVPLVGFMLTLAAALSWACGNIFNKKIMSQTSRPPIMSLVVWSALIPVLPFMLASLLIDGPQTMLASLQHIDLLTILSLLYLAFIATIVGYGIWGSLLGRYETWRVAPLSLLVPVVGMASAALLLGETLSGLQLTGAVLIMAGLYINVFGLRLVRLAWRADKKAPETGLYTIMRVMASQVVLLVVRHAKFVRFIITSRHMIEIKRRIIMFGRDNHCITLVLTHRRGVLLRIAEAGGQRQEYDSCGSE